MNGDRVTLEWDGHMRTVPLNSANVAFLRTASGYQSSRKVITALSALVPAEQICFPVHLIPPEDADIGLGSTAHLDDQSSANITDTSVYSNKTRDESFKDNGDANMTTYEFGIDDMAIIEKEEELREQDRVHLQEPSSLLLHWHYRLGHLSFKTLQEMAKAKILPPALATCAVPKCATCLYGKATKRAWRTRALPNKIAPAIITGPGDCISIDQIESSTTGVIAQITGFLTRQRYTVATVFVDHYSRLSFVYLQKGTKGDEKVQAKRAFEAYAHSHGVSVRHYHADNGRFAGLEWMAHLKAKQQMISHSGINAHFQNALAEKQIWDLQDAARTMLVHAKQFWPKAISAHL
jgi:hypothetical protein